MAPAPTPTVPWQAVAPRNLGNSLGTTYSAPTDSAVPTVSSTSLPDSGSGVTSGSILNFAAIVAALAVIGTILLWRIAKIRAGGLPLSFRAFFLPKGMTIARLGIHIKPCPPTQRHIEMMEAVRLAELERTAASRQPRVRRSRRATTGPGIGDGGRRVSEAPGELDIVDEHGNEIAHDDEQLPGYERDKLPGYNTGLVWDESGHRLSSGDPQSSRSQPTAERTAVETDQAYEARVRGQPEPAAAAAAPEPPAYDIELPRA